jgi:two-component system sensor histidine kinase BaeS
MSFRLRVLVLVALVAVTAVGATAFLAFRQASRQVTESAAADQATTSRIITELTNYARRHGTWEGVPHTVQTLTASTGQRIRLVTDTGQVIVDSDTLANRTARPVTGRSTLLDPRPRLELPTDLADITVDVGVANGGYDQNDGGVRTTRTPTVTLSPQPPATVPTQLPGTDAVPADSVVTSVFQPRVGYTVDPKLAKERGLKDPLLARVIAQSLTQREIVGYRAGVRFAACMSRHGGLATVAPDAFGVPWYGLNPGDAARGAQPAVYCWASTENTPDSKPRASVTACTPVRQTASCLEQAFAEETRDLAPVPVQVYLGAVGDAPRRLAAGPVIAAAALVALLALVGTALLSRRVLRPIAVLTAASQRLGAGDLTLRVPAVGRDELAQLARSFNRMADSLQRGEERQRRLVADVAHELRTPLANLRGYLEALKDGVLPTSPELFASLHEEAVLQQRIVDDLQDLALAEAGVLAYHMASTDLVELLETCGSAQQGAAEAAGVALRVVDDGPVIALLDPDRLRQVIGNLVANAVRATPRGGAVTLSATGPVAGWATIEVRDTGVGIAAANLPHVFDRFWRADAARGRATGGSGLGLAIARQIIADHGGQIRVDSELGAGTVFTITLPARDKSTRS